MKTRDKEALEYILWSGHWRLEEDGSITTRRDRHGRVTDPEVWRPCEFLSTGNRSSTRKRIWVNGQRVYSARVAYTLHNGALPPEGMQVDHEDDDSLNNRGSNLQLLDCHGNIHKETKNGRVKWFEPKEWPLIAVWHCVDGELQTGAIGDLAIRHVREHVPGVKALMDRGLFMGFLYGWADNKFGLAPIIDEGKAWHPDPIGRHRALYPITGEGPVILGVDCASGEDTDYEVNWNANGSWTCIEDIPPDERPELIDWRISLVRELKQLPRKFKEWWRDDVIGFIKGKY